MQTSQNLHPRPLTMTHVMMIWQMGMDMAFPNALDSCVTWDSVSVVHGIFTHAQYPAITASNQAAITMGFQAGR
eukprot:5014881-Karenia_brevis.AAC.1